MRIEDNGQVIIAESDTHSTVRSQDDYSSGQHKFRFMIEQLNKNNWIFFGIVSKNTPLHKTSC